MKLDYQCTYCFGFGSSFEQKVESVLLQMEKGSAIVRLVFFATVDNNDTYIDQLRFITQRFSFFFADRLPLISYVAQPVCSVSDFCVEVHTVSQDIYKRCSFKQINHLRYLLLTADNGSFLMMGGVQGHCLSDSVKAQSDAVFSQIESTFLREKFDISDIVRQWNYIEQITSFEGEIQHYQAFNDARSLFYEKGKWSNGYPAATGIGTSLGGILVDLIAFRPFHQSVSVFPLDNPLQVAAHAYSQDCLLGDKDLRVLQKTTPKFERAKVLFCSAEALCFVSGTAAIRGELSLAGMDISQQTHITIENIEYLISKENLHHHGYDSDLKFRLSSLRVYLKHTQDKDIAKNIIDSIYLDVPVVFLSADVCRDELLIEMEAIVTTLK